MGPHFAQEDSSYTREVACDKSLPNTDSIPKVVIGLIFRKDGGGFVIEGVMFFSVPTLHGL